MFTCRMSTTNQVSAVTGLTGGGFSVYLLVTHDVSLQYLPVGLVTVVDKEAVEPLAGLCDSVPAG